MKHFAELLQEAETKMPLSFHNLLESINSGCLTEAETFSFCDSFGTFLKEFHPAYLNVASYFGLDDKATEKNFKTKSEAIALSSFIKSKFFRFMIGILKTSQNVLQNVYQFVPLQDFSSKSDIDWSKSIEEIDKQLYKKYRLTKEEISFIESLIKPMS
jgi:hypothetical protein